ncbi:hypothetical protein BH11VER1_BH11VER1_28120 [soil metagenome]
MKTVILAKSSSGGSYDVSFETNGDALRVTCTCKAGLLQQLCKHKITLIKGDETMLFDGQQEKILRELQSLPQHTILLSKLTADEALLGSLEQQKAKLAAEEKAVKSRMSKLLARGIS